MSADQPQPGGQPSSPILGGQDARLPALRPYQAGDEAALTALFAAAYGHTMSEALYRWKLTGLPSPTPNVWAAWEQDRPIFHYASIPTPYRTPDGPAILMTGADLMTTPDQRRRGLLTAYAPQIYETWSQAGLPFTVGLPNERWGSRADHLGWQPLLPLAWLIRPLRPEALIARRLRLPFLARAAIIGRLWQRRGRSRPPLGIEVQSVTQADGRFDRLWQTAQPRQGYCVQRDRRWVDWRFLSAPTAETRWRYHLLLAQRGDDPVGYLAYRVQAEAGRMTGFIADLFTAPADEPARLALLAQALRVLYDLGAEKVATLALPTSPLYHSLAQAGFRPALGAFTVRVRPLAQALDLDTLRQPASWYLTGSDFDVI
ncbi:MAG: GNAT family N-acetyltransferase [Anaerolineae bacterium]